jgi:hypothetical protein
MLLGLCYANGKQILFNISAVKRSIPRISSLYLLINEITTAVEKVDIAIPVQY